MAYLQDSKFPPRPVATSGCPCGPCRPLPAAGEGGEGGERKARMAPLAALFLGGVIVFGALGLVRGG